MANIVLFENGEIRLNKNFNSDKEARLEWKEIVKEKFVPEFQKISESYLQSNNVDCFLNWTNVFISTKDYNMEMNMTLENPPTFESIFKKQINESRRKNNS